LLHRAFSILIFDSKGRLLLQQRSADKRLWGGYWSNSCCSHPRKGESMREATARRMQEELGLVTELTYLYKFQYSASFGELGTERELCSVYAGVCDDVPQVNINEISSWRYITRSELECELTNTPEKFTPWFKLEWKEIITYYMTLTWSSFLIQSS